MSKPYAPSCDRNRDPILAVLRDYFGDRRRVLEIGSGTGQHAVYFAAALPLLTWQTSDRVQNLPGIRMWLDEANLANTPPPIALDVNGAWPIGKFDAVFMANTLHIMGWSEVEKLFAQFPSVVEPGTVLIAYGPFNYAGRYTSQSNKTFDMHLKAEDPKQGLRDVEAVDALARGAGFALVEDRAMPANNRTLVFRQSA